MRTTGDGLHPIQEDGTIKYKQKKRKNIMITTGDGLHPIQEDGTIKYNRHDSEKRR